MKFIVLAMDLIMQSISVMAESPIIEKFQEQLREYSLKLLEVKNQKILLEKEIPVG
jgi:hypothetical protein